MNKLDATRRIQCIIQTVDELSQEYPDGVPEAEIVVAVTGDGHDAVETMLDLDNLATYVGHLYSPQPDWYLLPR